MLAMPVWRSGVGEARCAAQSLMKSKAAVERAAMARAKVERERLHDSCTRLAGKIKAAPGLLAGERDQTASQQIEWGPHTLTRGEAIALLSKWALRIEEYDVQLTSFVKKCETLEKGSEARSREVETLTQSMGALEGKIKDLLTRHEVLEVQKQVADVLAAVSGEKTVPGEIAGLVAEMQEKNDAAAGYVEA